MRIWALSRALFVLACGLGVDAAVAQTPAAPPPYSQPGVDAPALAALGPYGVGVRSITLVERAVPDVRAYDKAKGAAPLKDRPLEVDIWYPAKPDAAAKRVVYSGRFPSETPGQWAAFTDAGLAVRDAAADRRQTYPLVVMSHGYSGTPVALSWLAENLASKGYVVAAAHHEDPPITDASAVVGPLLLPPPRHRLRRSHGSSAGEGERPVLRRAGRS